MHLDPIHAYQCLLKVCVTSQRHLPFYSDILADTKGRVMSVFSNSILSFWQQRFLPGNMIFSDRQQTLVVHDDCAYPLMQLKHGEQLHWLCMTPGMAERLQLNLDGIWPLTEQRLQQTLQQHGLEFYGEDNLYYFPASQRDALLNREMAAHVRRLTTVDIELFKTLEASATEQDLDDAYVELDHWRVFGAVVDGKLVAAASMYPWDNSKIADMGVLTLPEYRGQGYGKAVVQALAKHAYEEGYEPQYRHQLHNASSKGVALGCGFEFFGQRDVVLLPE